MHVDVLNGDFSVEEILLIHDSAMQRNEMFNTCDHRLIECGSHSAHGVLAIPAPDQQFC